MAATFAHNTMISVTFAAVLVSLLIVGLATFYFNPYRSNIGKHRDDPVVMKDDRSSAPSAATETHANNHDTNVSTTTPNDDEIASLRSQLEEKEKIIENLMLRYDLGILSQDTTQQSTQSNSSAVGQNELTRKASAVIKRTVLENFKLRERLNKLNDENFHLKNEIYDLQNKINGQVLRMHKLENSFGSYDVKEEDSSSGNAYSTYLCKAHSQNGFTTLQIECAVFGFIHQNSTMDIPRAILGVCLRFYSQNGGKVNI